jgi:DNA-binding NarL/FixJ family response regulator
MIATTPTFIIQYSREQEHATETEQLKARIAELEGQLARLIEPLSPAEIRVLRLVACGMDYIQAGKRLGITERTVRSHMYAIYRKTGTRNQVQAARYALRNGYVDIDDAWQTVQEQEWGAES